MFRQKVHYILKSVKFYVHICNPGFLMLSHSLVAINTYMMCTYKHQCFCFVTGYIAHMLHDRLDSAYVLYALLFLLGYFIVFGSGFILDVQGVQWVMVAHICGSLPLYLIAEWLHKHFKLAATNSKVCTKVAQLVSS